MQSKLELLMESAGGQLQAFALSDQFWPLWDKFFERRYDLGQAIELRKQWQRGDYSRLPIAEVIRDDARDTSTSGDSLTTQTISLVESFLNTIVSTANTSALPEQIGHHVDALPNTSTIPDAEGEAFSQAVQKAPISQAAWLEAITQPDPSSPSQEGPDLLITEATAPATASIGSSLLVSWTTKNNGTQTANSVWWDGIYLSTDTTYDSNDTFVASVKAAESPLAAGSSYTLSKTIVSPGVTSSGTYYLLFRSDANSNQ